MTGIPSIASYEDSDQDAACLSDDEQDVSLTTQSQKAKKASHHGRQCNFQFEGQKVD